MSNMEETIQSYACKECGKTFLRDYHRKRHEVSCGLFHQCNTCGAGFSNAYNGRRHEEVCSVASPAKKVNTEPTKHELLAMVPDSKDLCEYESSFKGRLKSYFIRCESCGDLNSYLKESKERIIHAIQRELCVHKSLKVNMLAECRFIHLTSGDIADRSFKTRNQAVFLETDLTMLLETHFKKLAREMEESQLKGSNWALLAVDGVRLRINKYNPLRGSTYIPLPPGLEAKKACINPRNLKDERCFMYAILAKFIKTNAQRVSKYKDLESKYNFSCVSFPTSLADISKFEKSNDMSVNVFGLDDDCNLFPLKVVDTELVDHRDLLLISDDTGRHHYVFIKDFDKLMGYQLTHHQHRIYTCKRCFTHFDNRYGKSGLDKLEEHRELCFLHDIARVKMPTKKPILQFINVEKMLRMSYVIYADFESILIPHQTCLPNPEISYTATYQSHVPMSFGVYVKPSAAVAHLETNLPREPYIYRGPDAAEKFMEYLISIASEINRLYSLNVPKALTDDQEAEFQSSVTCYLCHKEFPENDWKVRDHCHLTGVYRGSAHNTCNLRCKTRNPIPVFLHNLSGFDSHFIVKQLGCTAERVEVIPNSEENYLSFTKHVGNVKLRFLDTFRFMPSSLSKLVGNLTSYPETSKYFGVENSALMTRKGVYPYDYVDSWEKLSKESLPPKEEFFNRLNQEDISVEDYEHALHVWKQFQIKSLGEYSDLYLTSDVLLLADVFETFRNKTLETHKVDPAHYFTSPGLTWDAMLLYTGTQLELLQDYDQILMIESGIRGGLCQVSHRYAEANNKYMENFDSEKPSQFITYDDANNQYGWAMCHRLPYGGFKWVSPDSIDLDTLKEDDSLGYILEVDVDYPSELHDLHDDLPFLPECKQPKETSLKKLIPHLGNRRRYVVHYMALKQALDHGLKLIKIHRALSFKQLPWLKSYVEFNNNLRKQAKNDFEKDLYKLFNNAMFGKTMENIRNRLDIRLVTDSKMAEKLIAKPTFIDRTIYGPDLAAFHMAKRSIVFDKPIYIGMCVLDISKTLMYSHHYNVLLPYYGVENIKLAYMDTDSFIYLVKTEDVYQDKLCFLEHLDTSDYPNNHICYSVKNKKALGKFKDEACAHIIRKFVGLRAKMYALDIDGVEVKKIRGISRGVVRKCISFQDYKDCLMTKMVKRIPMNVITSKHHEISSVQLNKIALCPDDDKRVIAADGIATHAHGHYAITESV